MPGESDAGLEALQQENTEGATSLPAAACQQSHVLQEVRYDNTKDGFSLPQALKDWGSVLVKPRDFFEDQAGRSGMLAPLSLAILYLVPAIICPLLEAAQMSRMPEIPAATVQFFTGVGLLISLVIGVPTVFCIWLLFALVVHNVKRLFRIVSPYSVSFRTVVYSCAPLPFFFLIYGLLAPLLGIELFWLGLLFILAGYLWSVALLCVGVSKVQQVNTGRSIGVVVLSLVFSAVLYLVLWFTITFLLILISGALGTAPSGGRI